MLTYFRPALLFEGFLMYQVNFLSILLLLHDIVGIDERIIKYMPLEPKYFCSKLLLTLVW